MGLSIDNVELYVYSNKLLKNYITNGNFELPVLTTTIGQFPNGNQGWTASGNLTIGQSGIYNQLITSQAATLASSKN
jgi:hypothetical protein